MPDDPSDDDEVVNLLMDEEDEDLITVQSDVDDNVEELFSTSPGLSDSSDSDPDGGLADIRSEEDRSDTELSETWEGTNRRRIEATDDEALTGGPEEGTNEAVQSGPEGTNEADRSGSVGELEQALVDSLALPFSDVSQTEEAQAPPMLSPPVRVPVVTISKRR